MQNTNWALEDYCYRTIVQHRACKLNRISPRSLCTSSTTGGGLVQVRIENRGLCELVEVGGWQFGPFIIIRSWKKSKRTNLTVQNFELKLDRRSIIFYILLGIRVYFLML